jgi:hypothetical protein
MHGTASAAPASATAAAAASGAAASLISEAVLAVDRAPFRRPERNLCFFPAGTTRCWVEFALHPSSATLAAAGISISHCC